MPPKFKLTKDEITRAALDVTREKGASGLTARSLAEALGCSVKPIFSLFKNMEEVQREVLSSANELYQSYIKNDMESGEYPPYKASGMAYIRFAREQKELFKLLFMRDRTGEEITDSVDDVKPVIDVLRNRTGFSEATAERFHTEMWIFVHGIATMAATGYLDWDTQTVSEVLSDSYFGILARFKELGLSEN